MTDRVNAGHLFWPGLLSFLGFATAGLFPFGLTRLIGWLVDLGFALLALALFPRALTSIAAAMEGAPGPSLGWGLLIMLATPPALVMLAITIVGIPVVFVTARALAAAKAAGSA